MPGFYKPYYTIDVLLSFFGQQLCGFEGPVRSVSLARIFLVFSCTSSSFFLIFIFLSFRSN